MKGFEPTLLDKLMSDPYSVRQSSTLRRLSLDELKDSVALDVERLLNSRFTFAETALRDYVHCQRSVVTYGLCDFSGRSLLSFDDRVHICRSIENAIARHEPRLRQVHVDLVTDPAAIRSLCFSISAILQVKPAHEPVSFDAVLQSASLKYSVVRSRRVAAY